MSDLHTSFEALAGPATPPSAETVGADLARGQGALRRRRNGRIAAGAGFAAAAVLAAALAVPGLSAGPGTPAAAPTGGVVRVDAHLVAYTGKQPAGFTLDKVPAGWEVQGVDKYVLTLAPIGAADQDMRNLVGKIAISLSGDVPSDVAKLDVTVGGKPAVLATMKGDSAPGTIFQRRPDGTYLTIQVWDTLGWSPETIVQFADGVHVNKGAGLTVG
jgi:hypothetical protein